MANGWIALHRSLLDHWLWKDKPFSNGQAWIDLILLANHKDVKEYVNGSLKTFKKGTVNRSIESISHRWGWNRKKTRKFLNALEVDGMVSVNVTTHGTTISLINYDIYQTVGKTNGTAIDQTEGQPRENRGTQTTMNNNDNNENNKREEEPLPEIKAPKYQSGKYNNVLLTQEEAAKLAGEFPAEAAAMIEKLSEYMETTGKKYANHYAVICKWIREDREKPKQQPKKNQSLEFAQRTYTDDQIRALERKKLGLE
ncbi:MAG: hypothetical protein J5647_08805 [Spirochaetaceae bacterium]|nr:hypothetical protein [Spirochaetaceae bacterium]MBR4158637.1 hypothetical protein [Spirochaetia bacterium]